MHEQRKLAACHAMMNLATLNDWKTKAQDVLAASLIEIVLGLEIIKNAPPDNPGLFALKRDRLSRLVERVHIATLQQRFASMCSR